MSNLSVQAWSCNPIITKAIIFSFAPYGGTQIIQNVQVWTGFPKISKAMDGLREAHMDVLVAVFGKPVHTCTCTQYSKA